VLFVDLPRPKHFKFEMNKNDSMVSAQDLFNLLM
jgi:hypothetical protein